MNDSEKKLLADLRPEPPRSRLEPHLDFVRELRRRGRTFRRIAEILKEKFAIKVSPGTIHAFLTAKKRRKHAPRTEPKQPVANRPIDVKREPPSPPKLSDAERKAVLAKIREANRTYEKERSTTLPTFRHTDEPLIFETETQQKKEK